MKESADTNRLSESLEDCLETILRLAARDQVARARDIALALDVRPPTVTAALRALRDRGLIEYEPYGQIRLTVEGEKRAKEVTARHTGLLNFLTDVLAIDSVLANQAACRMEHVVPTPVLNRMGEFLAFLERHPDYAAEWKKESGPMPKPSRKPHNGSRILELNQMPFDLRGRVHAVSGDTRSKKRLFELGILPGAPIEVLRVAPLGDPLEVKVNNNSTFSIRKEDAARVSVEF